MQRIGWLALVPMLALACATSPTGRSQLRLFPESELAKMGVAAYDQMKQEMKVSDNARAAAYVRCVAAAITAEVEGEYAGTAWEVTLFEENSPNAFALPGGKIGVHTGLLVVAKNQSQLATVLGHEVAHVTAAHGNERVSTAFAAQSGLALAEAISGAPSPTKTQLLGLLGVGAQVGVLLPFSRAQEREADELGLDLMVKAGFDPTQSVALWKNMEQAGGGQPPEFLSTHPSHGTRIRNLEARMPAALLVQAGANQRGKRPRCS
ncbi:MAG: M48 family metallopeptidase [Myxococcota bacterium]